MKWPNARNDHYSTLRRKLTVVGTFMAASQAACSIRKPRSGDLTAPQRVSAVPGALGPYFQGACQISRREGSAGYVSEKCVLSAPRLNPVRLWHVPGSPRHPIDPIYPELGDRMSIPGTIDLCCLHRGCDKRLSRRQHTEGPIEVSNCMLMLWIAKTYLVHSHDVHNSW